MSEVFNIFCDESCHLENDGQSVMVLGATWCPLEKTREIAVRLREIKQHHGDFQTYEFIKAFKKEATEPKISLLIPVMPGYLDISREQVDAYIDAGVDSIEVLGSLGASDRYIEVIEYVKGRGVQTEVGIPNAVRLPFEEVTEFSRYGGGVYVTSRHWRPIYALASHAFLSTLTDEEMASVMGTALADKHLVPGETVS